jgi:1-acyl-sn-glycerol-3-phosphate acyltransferase
MATHASARGRRELLYPLVLCALDVAARLLFRLEVRGIAYVPTEGSVLIIANHVSYLDPCVLAAVAGRSGRRLRFLALADLFSKPGLGWVLRKGRMIPVERGRGADQMIARACAALDAGEAVLVYPEGTIPSPGEIVGAKRGAGLLALRSAAPVIPVATSGLERRRGRLPPLRRRVVVAWGRPLDLDAFRRAPDRDAQRAAAEDMLAAVRSLACEARAAASR